MAHKVIFVVDDEFPIAQTLAVILQTRGYSTFAFLSPVDALKAVGELGFPDLVITDFKMPEMDGLTFAGIMTGMNPRSQVLVLTGAPQLMESHPDRTKYECLIKPIPPLVLVEAVAAMLPEIRATEATA